MIFKGHALSKEQLTALHLFTKLEHNDTLVIDAGAGSSKTFTCNAIATQLCSSLNVLVLAFNSIIVEEMKDAFPDNVLVSTTHAFARGKTRPYPERKLKTPLVPRYVADALELPSKVLGIDALHFAAKIIKAISDYCVSDIDKLSDYIASNSHKYLGSNEQDAVELLINQGKRLWQMMTDRQSQCPVTHDVYLKEFVLLVKSGSIKLDFDVVILDEAQDTTPIVKQFVEILNAKKIAVGDKYQSIYEWRNAVNVMEDYMSKGNTTTRLTTCYRFGESIANISNSLIEKYYGTNPNFKGNVKKNSQIHTSANHEQHDSSLLLFRTNAELMATLVDKVEKGEACCMLKDQKESLMLIDDAQKLYNGQRVTRGILSVFANWHEFEQYTKNGNGSELRTFQKTVEMYGFDKVRSIIKATANMPIERAKYVFATAHSTKGIEFKHVVIGADFDQYIQRSSGRYLLQEINLLYVALTRAVESLDVSQCSTLVQLVRKPAMQTLATSTMAKKRQAVLAMFG
ncbi:UvrD-helicase domain-containing protein [Vibrio tubiashii]|uniref:UvrD-helicase domain-containing protein n=1 Tax=Vibrio tubiashii TaxID=29498 RepID=UPI001EFC9839|nr:UvrD-helicase domain-containing protein [Vibrio tubiashii]MCG9575371.1 UvrD-helicase domain-containing protein [Vibrio tubiashii]